MRTRRSWAALVLIALCATWAHAAGMWVGINNGLARLREGKFKTLNTHDGLFANNVFSMVTGQDGSLWVGSYGGVAHIAKTD